MRCRLITALLISCTSLLACNKSNAPESAWQKPETHTINCGEYFSEATPNGVLYNNVWNKTAAKSLPWQQCLEKDIANEHYGWSWVWPTKSHVIYAYPQIKLGVSPWAPQPKLNTDFPIENTKLRSLIVEHRLEIQGQSEHNVATTLWLTQSKDIGENPNPSIIIAELMIWSYATAHHMTPAGSHTGNFEDGNQTWEVWSEKKWGGGAASGAKSNKWTYITFRAKNNSLDAKFDVIKLTNYAIAQQILPQEFYIADIELGTEIMSGSGLAWVKKFVTIQHF